MLLPDYPIIVGILWISKMTKPKSKSDPKKSVDNDPQSALERDSLENSCRIRVIVGKLCVNNHERKRSGS